MRTLSHALVAMTVVGFLLAGCSGRSPALPEAGGLLAAAADAKASVQSFRFVVDLSGNLKASPLRHADGVVTNKGSAEGNAKRDDQPDVHFIIVGDFLYTSVSRGPYMKLPMQFAMTVYDPKTMLDPERGIASLLRAARNARTIGQERIGGRDTYRVSFEPTTLALAALIPGTGKVGVSQVWLDTETRRVAKAELSYPSAEITLTVLFQDYDTPVTIVAPS